MSADQGDEVALIAIEQPNRQVKVSFRSRLGINVAVVAEQFQGGGHKQAAGAILPGPLMEAYKKGVEAHGPRWRWNHGLSFPDFPVCRNVLNACTWLIFPGCFAHTVGGAGDRCMARSHR
ncbi:MAG: DHHA1 domain-containing protein [Planctomycetales bacterium]